MSDTSRESSTMPAPDGRAVAGLPCPVSPSQRIPSIDALRGFALLGILVMNIQSFSMIVAAYMNPTAYGDLSRANYLVWLLSHVFADQKFMTLFSLLFGAGLVLMSDRQRSAGFSNGWIHCRRMFYLLIFGLLHAYLLWYGDILVSYAICGMIVYWFRNLRSRYLMLIGVVILSVPHLIILCGQWSLQFMTQDQFQELAAMWQPTPEGIAQELSVYRGGWTEQMALRVPAAWSMETLVFLSSVVWRVCGLMLIGMAFYKLGVFSAKRSTACYLAMIVIGFGLGVPVILRGVRYAFEHDWDVRYVFFLWRVYNYWASLLVGLGWIGVVMLVCRRRWWPGLTSLLAAVGRTALSNYLFQTIICTSLFYGHGLAWYGRVSRLEQIGLVCVIWTLQILLSWWWLKRFRFGPVEWFWRTLVYQRIQPMRRATATSLPL